MSKRRVRKRGGASMPCPRCGAPTEVLRTGRSRLENKKVGVVRERRCRSRSCRQRFHTAEEKRA